MKIVGKGISIIYSTYRQNPQFQWFADSLAWQLDDHEVEVIVVDGNYSTIRSDAFTNIAGGRFPLHCVPAMPSRYSGPERLSQRDLFSAASARNTGAIYAQFPYLVFADDQSVLTSSWWSAVKNASKAQRIIAGAYQKANHFDVQNGIITNLQNITISDFDCRWLQGSPTKPVKIQGDQLYGCSFGIPKELFLQVNGFDEICDPVGMEDAHFGMRLTWAGHQIWYDRTMLTLELEDPSFANTDEHTGFPNHPITTRERLNPTINRLDYYDKLAQFGIYRRFFPDKPLDASWMILDLLYGIRTSQTLDNSYLLATLTPADLTALRTNFDRQYWFNNQPIACL